MVTHLILDARAFLDLDDAIELEACTGFPTLEALRSWPGQVIAELTPAGRVFVEGTDDAVERLAPKKKRRKRKKRPAADHTLDALETLVNDLEALIRDSYGVAGLHLNGDVAPWDSLTAGGHFEDWLSSFDAAKSDLERRGRRKAAP